jgi:glycosyltransferase involved in cell wall biosynthesis/GT2 family glycosyltransferase
LRAEHGIVNSSHLDAELIGNDIGSAHSMNATARESPATVDVVVPTLHRPDALIRCLTALQRQQRLPDQVIVVVRTDDRESLDALDQFDAGSLSVTVVRVNLRGVLAAMSAGVHASTASVIAFTDDDAQPRADWLARIVTCFGDLSVGAVGGRDLVPGQEGPVNPVVGVFTRSGKLVGNHHLGVGPPRDVHVLKGVNMAIRTAALALPAEGVLRGTGAQAHYEVLVCAAVRSAGWRIVYDPAMVVDHEGAARVQSDSRDRPPARSVVDGGYNWLLASTLLEPAERSRRVLFAFAIGTRDQPGMIRVIAAVLRGEGEVLRRAVPSIVGKLLAFVTLLLRSHTAEAAMVPASELRSIRCERPRLVLIAHEIHPHGGMERAYTELVRQLHDVLDIIVIASVLDDTLRAMVEWHPIRVPRRPIPVKSAIFFARAGLALRRVLKPGDVVQALGAIVPNRVDVVTMQFCHAAFQAQCGRAAPRDAPLTRRVNIAIDRRLALLAERWCYRPGRVRTFFAASDGVGTEAKHNYPGIPAITVANGVDTEHFRPDPATREQVRQRESAGTATVCLFVGGDWHRKGLGVAIEAVARARAAGADVILWVVGTGDTPHFQALAQDLNAVDSVRFMGSWPDPAEFYQAADLFLFPTRYEAFSLAMLEAASSGLPLLVPAVNGAEELVGADEGGFLLEPTAKAFGTAIVQLAADAALRERLIEGARRRASQYTWPRVTAQALDIYRQLSPCIEEGAR